MNYSISCQHIGSKYLQVSFELKKIADQSLILQLPSWRPGRYQIQNFAKNVRNFQAKDSNGEALNHVKVSKDRWRVPNVKNKTITISYEYYANQQDAGGSFIDHDLIYVNPVNLLMYEIGKEGLPCTLAVEYKANHSVACGLPFERKGTFIIFQAKTYHDLVDAPFIISNNIDLISYEVNDIPFKIWIKGKTDLNKSKIIKDFTTFTKAQIDVFGEFPEDQYHFILWILPFPYYHGVEHFNSTMMVLGPEEQPFEEVYSDFLGLASHELFHTWNVKKIRPLELLPYQYEKENYFDTCFVAEGITTFYGDWILFRSGVITKNEYKKELESTMKRHFDFANESTLSLLESSFDLWLDGYEAGAPNRKVSVYHKGAVAAMILNEKLKSFCKHDYPLDILMKEMWERFGKTNKGYTYKDIKKLVYELSDETLSSFFEKVIEGNESLLEMAQESLLKFDFNLLLMKDKRVQLEG